MSDLPLGTEFAGCRIEAVLGRGGMGVVYRAREVSLDRAVAIKLINDDLAADAAAHRRFEREARLMASIDHPNVIPVYAAGEEDGHLYLVMRYVDGTDLQALLRAQGRLPASQAARITDQVARAVDAAHERGLVHRDIKPSNVLLSGDHAYLTDFGITRLVDERTSSTDAGKWVGTFDYMSPEQLRGEPTGPRSDVYSLGCLLYACLAGAPPFHRDTTPATITAQLHEEPPSLADLHDVPRQFDEVVRRALAKQPRDRYNSAGQVGSAALAAAEGRRSGPRRFVRRSQPADLPPNLIPIPPVMDPHAGDPAGGAPEGTKATVVQGDVDTKVDKTAVMPPPAEATGRSPRPATGGRLAPTHLRVIGAASAVAVVALAVALLVIVLSSGGGARTAVPLTAKEITAAAHSFAGDYSRRDVHSLSRLLASDVKRVDPDGVQRGRAAVLDEYRRQFVTKPVPTRYALGTLTVTTGWAGRAEGQYALTVSGGGKLSGHVVFGMQRTAGRVQVALISTR